MALIQFRYSNIYDINLAKWRDSVWEFENEISGKKFASNLQEKWNERETSIIAELNGLGFSTPKNIIGYIVTPWRDITAFSDPLTIPASKDQKIALVKVIHELIHIVLSFVQNRQLKEKIYSHLNDKYQKESYATRLHIAVNLIQEVVMMRTTPDLCSLLDSEKDISEEVYPGQKRAWEILGELKNNQVVDDPVSLLTNL